MNLNNFRDFLNIKNIVSTTHILRKNKVSGICNIDTDISFNLRNIARIFSKKYNKKLKFRMETL